MKRDDERPNSGHDDRDFADRLADHYAPPPWTSARRTDFDEGLRARIERPERRGFAVPVLATAVAAGLVWVGVSLLPAGDEPEPGAASAGSESHPVIASAAGETDPAVSSVWESELFLSSDVSPLDDRDDREGLPDDYLAIASLFMDG